MKMLKLLPLFIVAFITVSIIGCKSATDLNPNTAPQAVLTFSPSTIDISTIVSFSAVGCSDAEDSQSELTFRWDFEGQQQWTEPTSSITIDYKYSQPGVYRVGLKVIDTEGWSHEAYESVVVNDTIIK